MSDQFREKRYAALAAIAKKHGGTLVDRSYSLLRKPVSVRCANGHRFTVTPKNLMRGSWCVKCKPLGRQSEFLAAAQTLARKHGGKCLSESYLNARTNLLWKCKANHRWEATFDNVSNKKSWCPVCNVEGASERKARWWRSARLKRAKRSAGRK